VILNEIAAMGNQLTEGELMQLHLSGNIEITEDDYFSLIKKKTAAMFAACTAIGAYSANAPQYVVKRIRKYGELLGICFQIKDDIFDYSSNLNIGKPTGNDFLDGKITLPLIYALTKIENRECSKIISIIQNKDFTKKNIDKVIQFAHKQGGIEYSIKRMAEYKNKANMEIEFFSESEYRDALVLCSEFVTCRNI